MNTADCQYLKTLAEKLFVGFSESTCLALHIRKTDSSSNLVACYSDLEVFEGRDSFIKVNFTDLNIARFTGLHEHFVRQLKSELHCNARFFSEEFFLTEVVTWISGRLDSLGCNADAYQIGNNVYIIHMDKLQKKALRDK